jgi:hypothetical protein
MLLKYEHEHEIDKLLSTDWAKSVKGNYEEFVTQIQIVATNIR